VSNCWCLIVLLIAFNASAASVDLAWDSSPSTDITNYMVKYGNSPGIYPAYQNVRLSLTATITNLSDGFRYYFVVVAQSPSGESVASNEATWIKPFTNPPVYFIYQAEASPLILPMITMYDLSAMGGEFIVSTEADAGTAIFAVTVPFRDEYVIWGRILSPDEGTDSFYVSVNDESEDVYDTSHVRTNFWQWTTINGRGGNEQPFTQAWAIDPRTFILSGINQVKFRGREKGTGLDAILVTNDRTLVPSTPSTPTNLTLTVER
jgi:hypothetical protein